MKTNSVENRIREVAEKPINGRLNLVQYKKEKAKALKHKDVCKQIVEFADGNPYMPIYAILACGVAADAFKNSTFDKGYKNFNGDKAATCYKMARAYNEKMGIKGQPNDVVWRLVARYYEKVSSNMEDFEKALAKAEVIVDADARGNYEAICANIGM